MVMNLILTTSSSLHATSVCSTASRIKRAHNTFFILLVDNATQLLLLLLSNHPSGVCVGRRQVRHCAAADDVRRRGGLCGAGTQNSHEVLSSKYVRQIHTNRLQMIFGAGAVSAVQVPCYIPLGIFLL